MSRRPPGGWCIFLAALLVAAPGIAVDLKNRSTSSSGQFIVYCDSRDARARIVSVVEETKSAMLRLLHETDAWSFPIIVSLEPADPGQPMVPPVSVTLVSTIAGPKIDVAARIGEDPSKVFLQRHIIRAVLLEIAYRDRPRIRGGERYAEPPWWLAEGILQSIQKLAMGSPEIFRSIVNTEKLPSLEKLLGQPPVHLDGAAGAIDRACALALVEALLHLPNGPRNLGRFIRDWPEAGNDALGALAKHFPVLAKSPQDFAKWWTLQLATLAKSENWQVISPVATEEELRALLEFEVVVDKAGNTRRFAIGDFPEFVKLPGANAALRNAQVKIVTLSTRSDALFHPILLQYEEICRLLSIGKTKGIATRLADLASYRQKFLRRRNEITDYLNWYEATQTPGATGEFDKYLRAAESLAPKPQPPPPADPRISGYLDSLERDFAPLQPNMIPGLQPAGNASR
jgi:hypothetical protein